MKVTSNLISKYLIVFCLFLLNSLVNSKYYEDYYSFDGCFPKKTCQARSYPEIYKTVIHGLGPVCENGLEMIKDYFKCVDRFFECGYLNTYTENGSVSLNLDEGVMILDGIDISKMTEEGLKELQIPENIIGKLTPFFGLIGVEASNRLDAEKLQLTEAESEFLYNEYINKRIRKFEENFMKISEDSDMSKQAYQNLTLEAKTGLLSINNMIGEIPKEYHNFILNNKWDDLSHAIKAMDLPENLKFGNVYKKTLRKNADAYLIESIDEHIQAGHVLGAFVIDLSNEYKADLIKYETYINTIKSILKDFYDKEKCYTCKNKDIHNYFILPYRDDAVILTHFNDDYNKTMQALDLIKIPGSWSIDTRKRNTGLAIENAISVLIQEKTSFDNMKTIFLFSNGDPEDSLEKVKPMLAKYDINLAILDMSLGNGLELPYLAEGPYNYLSYDVGKYQDSTKNKKCLGKQVPNIFASQNIHLNKNPTFRNTSIAHNNTIYFQTPRSKGKNLKISLYLNTFPEENWMKLFVSYDYPYPGWNTNTLMHEGSNYLPLKTLVIGKDENNTEAFENDQIVYLTLQGSNSDFGIKIEDCDPSECEVGTNINVNDYPFPQWLLATLIIIAILVVLFVIWYIMRSFRKKDTIEDVEAGLASKYKTIQK